MKLSKIKGRRQGNKEIVIKMPSNYFREMPYFFYVDIELENIEERKRERWNKNDD